MPFTRAGFNARHRSTGIRAWTRPLNAEKRWASAELLQMEKGDYVWHGDNFLAWGEQCVIGTVPGIELNAADQFGLPESKLVEKPPTFTGKVLLTIYGEPASKANSRELVIRGGRWSTEGGKRERIGGRPMFIKSEKARAYVYDALRQIPPKARVRIEGEVRVSMTIFYASERPDLDESLILDVLQDRFEKQGDGEAAERVLVQKGVYRNDRQVREKHIYFEKDPANPRAEILIEPREAPIFREAKAA